MAKTKEKKPFHERDRAAVSLGRRGGLARAKKLSKKARKESSKKAIEARWAKYRAEKAKKAGPPEAKKPTQDRASSARQGPGDAGAALSTDGRTNSSPGMKPAGGMTREELDALVERYRRMERRRS